MIHTLLHLGMFLLGLALLRLFRPQNRDDASNLCWAFIAAYTVRFITIVALHAFSRDGIFMLDDRGYDEQGGHLANIIPVLNHIDLANELGTKHVGYPLMVGLVYFIGGHSILSAKLLNAFFGALLAPIMYWLASELGGDDPGLPRRAAWLAALFPFDIAWSGFLLRDTILEVLFAFLLAATVAMVKRRSFVFLVLVALTVYVMDSFRFYAVFVWAGAIALAALAWVARRLAAHGRGKSWMYFLGVTAGLIFVIALSLPWLLQQSQPVRVLALQVAGLGDDATPLSFGLNIGFLGSLARAIFIYLLGPFPWVFWGIDDPVNYLLYPGMYAIFALFPFFIAGIWNMIRLLDPLRFFLVGAFVLHALIEIYVFQGAPRQRMMTDSVFLLCAATAWPFRHAFTMQTRVAYSVLIMIALGHTILRLLG